ncbi:ClcB-like voltage-gated chloride channel protein [uncultured Castellaniella sp.]|uniref:ClcB-like voltage-gated chloride channel protein n=1 Tax=uncultured Castellaniella sp. TaxID=647907 RepID=UPI0026040801|nr:ClcB-like voltage-gated chloride channel protein [uncultured Castellaniella sp.]
MRGPDLRIQADGVAAMLCWAAIAGLGGALVTIAFHAGIHAIQRLFAEQPGLITQVMGSLSWPLRLLVPTLGGLCAGILLVAARRVSRDKHSSYMEAVAIGDGRMSLGQGVLRSLSSLCTVASGGSIGREGAMVHLAALWSSGLGRLLRVDTAHLRLLAACGAAAGVSAAYGAPLAGAVFVGEIILGSMSFQNFGPLLVAAAVSSLVMHLTGHYEPRYPLPDLQAAPVELLLPCLALGVLAGVGAAQFLRCIHGVKTLFDRTGLGLPWRLALGGLLLGALLTQLPDMAGNGNRVVLSLLHDDWAWQTVLLMLLCKVLATALTAGSGAVGGVFTPTLFVGGALGVLFGQVLGDAWPMLAGHGAVFALVGMGAFLAAATSAPFMAILMIFEMTLSYQMVLPLVLACVVAYFVSRGLAQAVMYEVTLHHEDNQALRQRLRQARLDSLLRPAETVVRTTMPVRQAQEMFLDYPVKYLYVVDEESSWQGVIAQQDLTRMMLGEIDVAAKTCGEVLRLDFVKPLYPDLSLDEAQAQFSAFQGERLPVVSRDRPARLLGVVYKSDLLERYSQLKRAVDSEDAFVLSPRRR